MSPNRYEFQIYNSMTWLGRRHYFRLVGGNGEIVLQSEGYTREAAAIAGVKLIKRHAPAAPMFKVAK